MLNLSDSEIKFALESIREVMPLAEKIRLELAGKKITKDDLSPVTVADFSIQAIIRHRLSLAFPQDAFLGEESSELLTDEQGGESLKLVTHYVKSILPEATPQKVCEWIDGGAAPKSHGRFWTLDPIDGTKGFLRGAQYAIALALLDQGKVKLGVLGCPHLNEKGIPELKKKSGAIAIGVRNQGAWIAAPDSIQSLQPLEVSNQTMPEAAIILGSVEPTHTDTDQLKSLLIFLGNQTPPRLLDSQTKYAALAAGYGDFFLYLLPPKKLDYRMKIWDVAPGSIIAEEAGGKVTDLEGNALDFSCGDTLKKNPGLLISNGHLHSILLEGVIRRAS
ncbi:MAG: 3'(2'),5'-bisphosphate nucleotidase [Candidatus Omnitrophica bacterium]|nr:3'(2'),5'-bisphosphate nucleotidase [Candidatus Omnitrophota bacterium]